MKIKIYIFATGWLIFLFTIHAHNPDTLRIADVQNLKLNKKKDSISPRTGTGNPRLLENFSVKKEIDTYYTLLKRDGLFKLGRFKKNNHRPYSKFIVPAALVSCGVIMHFDKSSRSIDLRIHNEVVNSRIKKHSVDDYLQFAPVTALYGFDLMGIKARHNIETRTVVVVVSNIIMTTIVQTMKGSINVNRPNGSNNNSFPSGHTAMAFTGAHILFREYKYTSPYIVAGGYLVATGVGLMRITNKRHWASDVLAGAGIGMLSVEITYLLLPVIQNMIGVKRVKNNNLVIAPWIGKNNYGLGAAYMF